MSLFDIGPRDHAGPATHNEDEYSFLNRSARPAAARVRELIDRWAAGGLAGDRSLVKARFKAEFDAVFFELFLAAVFRAMGCSVIAHPSIPESPKIPDLRIKFLGGEEVIVEATLSSDVTSEEKALKRRLGTLYDEINKAESPNFFIHLQEVSESAIAQPSGRRIRSFIEAQVANLDPDAVVERVQAYGLEGAPTWTYQEGDFELVFAVWPKSPALRGKAGVRPIGVYPSRMKWGGDSERMKRAVLRKASKYGQMETPYLVAVNVQGFIAPDRIEEMEALFGSEQFYGVMGQDEPEMIRAPDGAWVGPAGIQNRRVSGILFARVVPWNIATAPWCLYHNPFADRPCAHLDWKIPQGIPAHGKMTWADGHTPGELLGLPPEWPGELFDD